MQANSPVLHALAARYRASQWGRTGTGEREFILDFKDLLKAARSEDGDAREQAEIDLRSAVRTSQGMLMLETHPRDERLIHRVRLMREHGEAWLFAMLGELSPVEERRRLMDVIAMHRGDDVPDARCSRWAGWIDAMAHAAGSGASVQPLERDDLALTHELLSVLSRLLGWTSQSLMRFASCVLCGKSKRLRELQPSLESALKQLGLDGIETLEDLGITEEPRAVRLCGPLKLVMPDGLLDLSLLKGAVAISEDDVRRAIRIECTARRALTIENDTTFTELVKHAGDTLLIQTSYPGRAVVALFERLPECIQCWHFGDSDPAGFDILRDLRARTGRVIRPLHMHYRPFADSDTFSKAQRQVIERLLVDPLMQDCHEDLRVMSEIGKIGHFEQEMLGPPTIRGWPFYEGATSTSCAASR